MPTITTPNDDALDALCQQLSELTAALDTSERWPAGQWCREALFFFVWSCPQSVMAANLCELAGIENSP